MDQNPNDWSDVTPIPPPPPSPNSYPPPSPNSYPPPSPNSYPPPVTPGGLSQNSAAALAYITFVPAIIFLVLEPYNRNAFIRFHAFQSIAFSVVVFAIHFVLAFIPIIGWIISILLSLVFFIVWIITILKASRGEWYKLPVIGDFALTQARS